MLGDPDTLDPPVVAPLYVCTSVLWYTFARWYTSVRWYVCTFVRLYVGSTSKGKHVNNVGLL